MRATNLSAILLACMLGLLFTTGMGAQDTLKIKDGAGAVMLEVRETGVILKKVTTAERIATAGLTSADNGLMVYDTDTKSLWHWTDNVWTEVDGTDLIDDADHDPTNELQDWSTLPGIPSDFTDGTDDVNDADSDPANELQDWSTLPGIPADFADGTDDVLDADSDPTNERNIGLALNGTVLEITDAGGTLTTDLGAFTSHWSLASGKVYNNTDAIGIGTDDPQSSLHVVGNKGLGEHVMVIENLNHAGSGLNIKIDGTHPLFVVGEGGNPDFFITHPGASALAVFDDMTTDITAYLMNNGSLSMDNINLSQIGSPGGLIDQLGLTDFISGGVCKGTETLIALFNSIGLQSISLPDLPLEIIPDDLPDIPTNLPNLSIPNLGWNPPDPCLSIGPYDFCVPLNFTLPLSNLNSSAPIIGFNSAIDFVNDNNVFVNNALEDGFDGLKGSLTQLDGLEIPVPQLQMPATLGPITCPDPNPWDNFDISFAPLNPLNYNIPNPLSKDNAFITFTDQYDNKLGAITAQGMGEFSIDYFDKEKILEIGSHVVGLVSDDGNVVENAFSLVKDAIAFYKATDKMGVLYSSGHGDYAEWLERTDVNEQIGYGDIVGIRGGRISLSVEGAEQVMVASKAPIVLGNVPNPEDAAKGNNVAFIGQVPVKVMGPVHTGDFIIANPEMPGYGLAIPADEITAAQLRLAVGKSWETNPTPGFKYVNTIVGMHDNGWAVPFRKMQEQLDSYAVSLQELSARIDQIEQTSAVASVSKKPRR